MTDTARSADSVERALIEQATDEEAEAALAYARQQAPNAIGDPALTDLVLAHLAGAAWRARQSSGQEAAEWKRRFEECNAGMLGCQEVEQQTVAAIADWLERCRVNGAWLTDIAGLVRSGAWRPASLDAERAAEEQ